MDMALYTIYKEHPGSTAWALNIRIYLVKKH